MSRFFIKLAVLSLCSEVMSALVRVNKVRDKVYTNQYKNSHAIK